jgi:hypothetical protein
MTTTDDLHEARRALDVALGTLVCVGDYLGLQAQAAHLLNGNGQGPVATPPLHQAVTEAVRLAHNTLDSTDPEVPEHATERCVECGSARVVYRNHQEQPFCKVCADGRGPAPQVMPHTPPGEASASPFPRCERCHMPHDPNPDGLAAQVCNGFFADPSTLSPKAAASA